MTSTDGHNYIVSENIIQLYYSLYLFMFMSINIADTYTTQLCQK